ncbi:sensor histidine kinase [Paenibacillus sp. Soil724D2]|uniref:sensor histidine kinase n=1 Tax=Paenibacillus sp. (strain Soil724D2) TaxID=1736392 RepID=UPI001F2DFC40|nr:HAMP domain-containing sensor histidine kinase [Paenibacillus sp. Soil724D2]
MMYENEKWDSEASTRNVNKFAVQNNSQIAILDENEDIKFSPAYGIVVETMDKTKLKILLNNIVYLEGFQNLKLTLGSQIEVEDIFHDKLNQIIYLSSIKNDNVTTGALIEGTLTSTSQTTIPQQAVINKELITAEMSELLSLKKISGKIIALDIPTQISQMGSYSRGLLESSIDYWKGLQLLNKIKIEPGKTNQFHYNNPLNGMDNIVFVRPVSKENGTSSEYVFAISSLQPVGEAVDVLRDYYFYAFLVALLFIAVMALLFSKILSKPFIKMNQVATRMANLDFSEEVPVKSMDEFGNMAVSLNRLSKNLGTSLNELKIANEQLQRDIEKEKLLEVMRKEFVASVSHELKTPLGIIKGFAEGVKDHIAEHKREHYIDVILDEIDNMNELVLDLLDLAELESKSYKLDLGCFPIMDLIHNVKDRLTKPINEKKLKLNLENEGEDLKVFGDLRRLEQVITNILSNAIRHTYYEGFIQINVQQIQNSVCISVENSGKQIGDDDLKLIWDRFYRAEKSRDRKTGGTGLGLSIVKNILEMHGSKFGVENTKHGVRFYFTLTSPSFTSLDLQKQVNLVLG